ncbi:hypothetical protein Aerorivi_00019 [Aeromonas rivipollensis]
MIRLSGLFQKNSNFLLFFLNIDFDSTNFQKNNNI